MKHRIILSWLILASSGAVAQQSPVAKDTASQTLPLAKPVANVMPQFPGGDQALRDFLSRNIHYPERARKNETEGIVVVQFMVEANGRVDSVTVVRSVGDGCTEEAVRVVKLMPRWKPGTKDGVPVRVVFNLPISFQLSSGPKLRLIDRDAEFGDNANRIVVYLYSNVNYPSEARKNKIKGDVVVKFTVDQLGNVRDAAVVKGLGYGCDEEALRVVNEMPRWKPAIVNGAMASSSVTLQIHFPQ